MTCAPYDLDAFLDGDLAPEQDDHVREHVAACPACAAEVEAARQLAAAFARDREVRAPAAVVAAALAEAHRAPVRPAPALARGPAPRPQRRFRAPAFAALAALVAVSMTWAILEAPRTQGPQMAVVTAPVGAPPPRDAPPLADAASKPAGAPAPAQPAPPAALPAAQAPVPPPLPGPSAPDPAPEATDPRPLLAASPEPDSPPTAADIEQAKEDLQLAFALIDDAQRRASRTLRQEAGPLTDALDHTIPFSP